MTMTGWIGLTGSALLVSTVAMKPFSRRSFTPRLRAVVFLAFLLAAFLPMGNLPVAGYVRGLVGDFSVTTWMLLILTAGSTLAGKKLYRAESLRLLLALVSVSGCLLYPSALGLTYTDVYTWGYGSLSLLTGFLVVTLVAWYYDRFLVAIGVTATVLAYSLQIFESRNLWDYWLDPFVATYGLLVVARTVGRRLPNRIRTKTTSMTV